MTATTSQPIKNPAARVSFIMGLLCVPLFWLSGIVNVPFFEFSAVGAVLLGHIALSKSLRGTANDLGGKKQALCGLVLGYLTIAAPIANLYIGDARKEAQDKVDLQTSVENCRQIIKALHAYAKDHDGKYPDAFLPKARSSNEVFRQLFVGGYLKDEKIFGSAMTMFKPDGNIGQAPGYWEALKPWENHWAMTKGLTLASDPQMPLVYESPANSTWPALWNANLAGAHSPGRVWPGGQIIIGLNDGSASAMMLEARRGLFVGLASRPDGGKVFPKMDPKPEVLSVAR